MPHSGKGRRGILIVGEAPGRNEDEQGLQFVGKAGERLEEELRRLGVDMRRDCWITNALICRPPGNAIPDLRMIDYCRPNLMRTISELQPHTIILLGGSAVRSLIGDVWRENPGALGRWVGFNIPDQKLNAWLCPTYHPSYLEREKNQVLDLYFRRHLEEAFSHESRPWETIPDWYSKIEVIQDPDEAATALDEFEQEGGEIAYDEENNCIKPETTGGRVICASVSSKRRTIAYPWHGKAIEATKRLLHSDRVGIIAAQMKHEDRWTRFEFGRGIRHLIWDTVVAAHVIDNREGGICSLKFQAYVNLGMPSYDDHIKQFLKSRGDSKINRIREEIDMSQLMKYCGFDTFLTRKLKNKQYQALKSRNDYSSTS